MKKIPCKTCQELSWTSSEGFSYRVKITTSAFQSLKTKEITMMPVKPLKNYYPNHKYTHINAFSSLKITTVASMKPSSMQNLIQLFVRTGYLSGIKTTLSCPSETRSSCRPWVTAVWIIAGPVTSLSELGNTVWGLKNTFLYVWLIFHLVVSTWACSTQAVWAKQYKSNIPCTCPFGGPFSYAWKWEMGEVISAAAPMRWGEGSQDVEVHKGKSSISSSSNKYYFYCLKFYGKHEGIIKN